MSRDHVERLYSKVDDAVLQVDDHVKDNVFRALKWAKHRLMRLEGSGHIFHLHRGGYNYRYRTSTKEGVSCSFAKPSWAGDHVGIPMPTGALAIVQAVLEYENGL